MGNPAVTAPNAGAENLTAGAAADSQPVDYGITTDDQLLDQAEPGGEAGEAPGAAEAGAEPSSESQPDVEKKQELDEAEHEKAEPAEKIEEDPTLAVPPELKAMFKDPKVGPQVRDLYYRHAAYQQVFPTVAEARGMRELFPNGIEDAKAVLENAEQLERFDELFYSENPEDRAQFVASLHREDPEAFAGLIQSLPDTLYQMDPALYKQSLAVPLVQDFLTNMYNIALAEGGEEGENLKNAVDVLAHAAFRKTMDQLSAAERTPDPRATALERRQQELEKREAAIRERAWGEFHQATNDTVVERVVTDIRSTVDKLLEGSRASEGAKQRIVRDIYNELKAAMQANRDLRQQLRREYRNGSMDQVHADRIVNLWVGRAKLLLRPLAQKVVSQWTKDVLTSTEQRREAQNRAASRPDLSGGSPRGTPTGASGLKPEDVDYGATSDDDILEDRVRRRQGAAG
jgi:hypothetical protein